MAHIRMNRRKWRVQVERCGVRRSKVFELRSDAKTWGAATEAAILASRPGSLTVTGAPPAVAGRMGGAA